MHNVVPNQVCSSCFGLLVMHRKSLIESQFLFWIYAGHFLTFFGDCSTYSAVSMLGMQICSYSLVLLGVFLFLFSVRWDYLAMMDLWLFFVSCSTLYCALRFNYFGRMCSFRSLGLMSSTNLDSLFVQDDLLCFDRQAAKYLDVEWLPRKVSIIPLDTASNIAVELKADFI